MPQFEYYCSLLKRNGDSRDIFHFHIPLNKQQKLPDGFKALVGRLLRLKSASQSDGQSKPDPDLRPLSLSLSLWPVHLWFEVVLRFQPSQLVSFHLSMKLNTQKARRASGPRLMGLLKLRGTIGEKNSGFLPPSCSPFSLSVPSVCAAVTCPKLTSSSSSSSLTLKCRMGLEETRLEQQTHSKQQHQTSAVLTSVNAANNNTRKTLKIPRDFITTGCGLSLMFNEELLILNSP